jgi:alginate O-acetyltransferase complex protein AlgI
MVFSSSLFLFYFLPVFFISIFFYGKRYKNLVALLFSVLFYAWGAPNMIYLVLASLVIDFFIVRALSKSHSHRKILLISSVIVNIGMLGILNIQISLSKMLTNYFHCGARILLNGLQLFCPSGYLFLHSRN